MQAGIPWLWSGAAGAVMLALVAGWREHRRRHRRDHDLIGPIDRLKVQAGALIVAALLALLALKS